MPSTSVTWEQQKGGLMVASLLGCSLIETEELDSLSSSLYS